LPFLPLSNFERGGVCPDLPPCLSRDTRAARARTLSLSQIREASGEFCAATIIDANPEFCREVKS
jgi:hypothetical protein